MLIDPDDATVNALGIDVPGILFPAKQVNLKGFNGLKDGVKIKSFDLPSNDPAGGIHLTLEASTTNVRVPSFLYTSEYSPVW